MENSTNNAQDDDMEERPVAKQKRVKGRSVPAMSALERYKWTPQKLLLKCEWADAGTECSVTDLSIDDLIKHIKTIHLDPLHKGHEQNDPATSCMWSSCGHVAEDRAELVRHLYFHAFHQKIKFVGSHICRVEGLAPCRMDPANRNIVPELPDPLLCEWENCMLEYDCSEFFYRHVLLHADNIDSQLYDSFPCEWKGCDLVMRTRTKLKNHMRSHTQEKVAGCPTCGALFASRTKFIDHIARQQVHEQQFVCSNCSKAFSSSRLLKDHIRRHVNHYKCKECGLSLPTPTAVANHFQFRHSDIRVFPCQTCDTKFKTLSDLKRHIARMHQGPKTRLVCESQGCRFTCFNSEAMRSHHNIKHSDKASKFRCHLCNADFASGASVTRHLKNVHNVHRPQGHARFRYTLCGDGYRRLVQVRYEREVLLEMDGRRGMEASLMAAAAAAASSGCSTPAAASTGAASSPATATAASSAYERPPYSPREDLVISDFDENSASRGSFGGPAGGSSTPVRQDDTTTTTTTCGSSDIDRDHSLQSESTVTSSASDKPYPRAHPRRSRPEYSAEIRSAGGHRAEPELRYVYTIDAVFSSTSDTSFNSADLAPSTCSSAASVGGPERGVSTRDETTGGGRKMDRRRVDDNVAEDSDREVEHGAAEVLVSLHNNSL